MHQFRTCPDCNGFCDLKDGVECERCDREGEVCRICGAPPCDCLCDDEDVKAWETRVKSEQINKSR